MRSTSCPTLPEPAPIGDHRLLGDGRGALLLTQTAEANWWCAPRFDSPPTWWSLLDPDGPAALFDDVQPLSACTEPAGATTWTRLWALCGEIEVRDCLVDDRFLRVVRSVDGDLRVNHRTGFREMGADAPTRWVCSELRASVGEAVALSLAPGVVEQVDPRASEAAFARAAARFAHNARVRTVGTEAARTRVRDALQVMTALRYDPTGAVVAAATTSLPETPGHGRQFDYRYTWLRDGALSASVAALHNRLDLASSYLAFVERLGERVFDAPLFSVDASAVPPERTVDNVAGWGGSTPIRVGNAAAHQVQFDALGFVVEAVSTYTREGGRLRRPLWRIVRAMADRCCDDEPRAENGIWEFRTERALLSADIGRWIALDRALRVAKRRRPWTRTRRWRTAKQQAASRVLAELRDDGRLPQSYGGDPNQMDASALLVVMFGMLTPDDPRAARLVDAHLAVLSDGPFLRRYPTTFADEFGPPDATFTPCSWWAVTALSAVGRTADANERAARLCERLPRLLAEEFDPASEQSLGNTPLLWSHTEAARTMRVLHVADVRARRGRSGLVLERAWRRATARS